MGGLVLDKILVLLVRAIFQLAREIRTRNWNRVDALIDGSYAPENETYASLTYLFSLDAQEYYGRYEETFWDRAAAAEFASRYPEHAKIVIRYRPGNPDQSFFSESDQAISDPFSGSR